MTKAILNESELTQKNITQLLSQLSITEQNTYYEREEIISKFPPNDEEFSLIEELELLTVNFRGYAHQIQETGQVANKNQVIEQLKSMQVLNIPQIARFFFDNNGKYEQMKSYIRMLDYLRLLMLEYLQFQNKSN
ncbi:hypothetical protein [Anabaena azotica]|uniref:Uncharacterized protein n=1 Tax=Anabaena azotica FACHB-119 TaxID=947527 RepID=A0ABR8DBH5_9NOST|nr:hypothetical protein [Anabaena azotica]MBD2503705.1 hypothetical protein [Anabaena azotica FACHB-119]